MDYLSLIPSTFTWQYYEEKQRYKSQIQKNQRLPFNSSDRQNSSNKNEKCLNLPLKKEKSQQQECNEHAEKIKNLQKKLKQLQLKSRQLHQENNGIMKKFHTSSESERRNQQESEIWKKKYQKIKLLNQEMELKLTSAVSKRISQKMLYEKKQKEINREEIMSLTKRKRNYSLNQLKKLEQFYYNGQPQRMPLKQRTVNLQHLLTREQKNYVKQLQSYRQIRQQSQHQKIKQKTRRSASLSKIPEHSPSQINARISESNNNDRKYKGRNQNLNEFIKYSAQLEDGLVIQIIDQRSQRRYH